MSIDLSIIIPVYQTEQYLPKLIELLPKSKSIEIIIVNDASPLFKKSLFSKIKNPNLKIIHNKTNIGLYNTRLVGIEQATGKYIGHIDSDDWINPQMYTLLLEKAREYDADMVECGFQWAIPLENKFNYSPSRYQNNPDIQVYYNRDLIYYYLKEYWHHFQWNRIYKRSLFESIKDTLPINRRINVGEDLILTTSLLKCTRTLVRINNPLYYYHQRQETLTQNLTQESVTNRIFEDAYSFNYLEGLLDDNSSEINSLFEKRKTIVASDTYRRIKKVKSNFKNNKKMIKIFKKEFHSTAYLAIYQYRKENYKFYKLINKISSILKKRRIL